MTVWCDAQWCEMSEADRDAWDEAVLAADRASVYPRPVEDPALTRDDEEGR